MNNINQIIGGLFPHREPKEDEYINEADGLIYCAKCHTPRQCVIQHGDRIVTPPIMCDCQRIAEEKAEAAFKKRQEEFRIERMKASGLQDRYLHDYTFANDKGYNPEIKKAQRYAILYHTDNNIRIEEYADFNHTDSGTPKHKPNGACRAIKRHLCDGEPVGKRAC